MREAADMARGLLLEEFRWTHGHADFSRVLRNARLMALLGPALAAPFQGETVTSVIAIEARGFVFGGVVASQLGAGLVLARKPGGVHPKVEREVTATPDWRGRTFEVRISRDAIEPGDRLLLVDDWVETGSQARAVARLVDRLGGALVGTSVIVDDTTDEVRQDLRLVAVVRAAELPPAR